VTSGTGIWKGSRRWGSWKRWKRWKESGSGTRGSARSGCRDDSKVLEARVKKDLTEERARLGWKQMGWAGIDRVVA